MNSKGCAGGSKVKVEPVESRRGAVLREHAEHADTISVFCVFCGSIFLAVERTLPPAHRVAPNPPEVIVL